MNENEALENVFGEEASEKLEDFEEDLNDAKREFEIINQFLKKDKISVSQVIEHEDEDLSEATLEVPTTFEYNLQQVLDKIDSLKQEIEDSVDESSIKHKYKMACEKYKIFPLQKCLEIIDSNKLTLADLNLGPKVFKPIIESVFFSGNLTELHLQGNRLEAEGLTSVAYLFISNANITHLDYANNSIGPRAGGEALKKILSNGYSLTYLNLSQNELSNSQLLTILPALSEATRLSELDFSENNFSDDAGRYFAQYLSSAQSIRKLNLNYNTLGSGASSLFGSLRGNSSLKVLTLVGNEIGHECAIDFAKALDANKSLEELDLSYNRLTKETMAIISKGLKSNSALKVLNLECNPLFSQGALLLITAVSGGENKIEALNLTGIRINLAFLKVLKVIESSGRPFHIKYGNRVSFQVCTGIQQPLLKLLHLADANALSLKSVLVKIHAKFLTDRREAIATTTETGSTSDGNKNLADEETLNVFPRMEGAKFIASLATSALKVPQDIAQSLVKAFGDSNSTVDIGEIIASIPLRTDILEFESTKPEESVKDDKKDKKKK